MKRRLFESLDASKTEDIENVGERDTFPAPVIGIEFPLATCTDLTGEDVRESMIEELLVI